MKTYVTFESDAFNTTEDKPTFLNPGCYGDDVLEWLRSQLEEKEIEAAEPIEEDWGWLMFYKVAGQSYRIYAGYRSGKGPPDDLSVWFLFIEREVGILQSLFGHQYKDISFDAVKCIHDCLNAHPGIRNIRWHERANFDKGKEELGTPEP